MRYGMLTEPRQKNSETGKVLLFLQPKEVESIFAALNLYAVQNKRNKTAKRLCEEFDLLPIW